MKTLETSSMNVAPVRNWGMYRLGIGLAVALIASWEGKADDSFDALMRSTHELCCRVDRAIREDLQQQSGGCNVNFGSMPVEMASDMRAYSQFNAELDADMARLQRMMNETDPEKLAANARRAQVLGNMYDSQRAAYQRQGAQAAADATRDANMEYHRRTGRDFDPSRRPIYSGPDQDAWDACNRIHQIYK